MAADGTWNIETPKWAGALVGCLRSSISRNEQGYPHNDTHRNYSPTYPFETLKEL